jgi:hypothetical protein
MVTHAQSYNSFILLAIITETLVNQRLLFVTYLLGLGKKESELALFKL